MIKENKKLFVNAYIWFYGSSKKSALNAYKEFSQAAIKELINGYLYQTKQMFLND